MSLMGLSLCNVMIGSVTADTLSVVIYFSATIFYENFRYICNAKFIRE